MERMTKRDAKELWDRIATQEAKRESGMPTETDALLSLFEAHQRLKELGWKEAIYCPKDGTIFDAIEAGSTGIFECYYQGVWPKGSWSIMNDGDIWPSRPILFRLKPT